MSYNLIDNFREQGWDFLIPYNLEQTVTGEYVDFETEEEEEVPKYHQLNYGKNHTGRDFGEYEPEIWDEESDYFDDYDFDEIFEGEEGEEREVSVSVERTYDRPETLYDLKYALDCDALSDDEFLSLSIGELMGITNSQLKFVSKRAIKSAGISRYKDMLAEKKESIPSVEQRIKYANAILQVGFSTPIPPGDYCTPENIHKLDDYIKKIIFKHTEDEAVQLIDWHKDYMGMLKFASIINDEHRENGEQYFNYELFPKVSHIKDLHDKASRDYSTYMSREAAERKEETNYLISNFIATAQYKKFLYSGDRYSVIAVKDVDAILDEADNLKHCVASYIEDFAKGNSYLYFIRVNDALDKSLYTVEVVQDERSGQFILNQCYGYKDTTVKSEDLKQFIYKWCKIKKLEIDCPI